MSIVIKSLVTENLGNDFTDIDFITGKLMMAFA